MSPALRDKLTAEVRVALEDMEDQVTKKVAELVRREIHISKYTKTLIIHNVDKWVREDKTTEGYGIADRVTARIHAVTKGMVTVNDACTLGRVREDVPSSVMVTLGSSKQKACFYKVVATQVKNRTKDGCSMQEISCRDAFPRERVQLARELAYEG